jgi:hypothetical protein
MKLTDGFMHVASHRDKRVGFARALAFEDLFGHHGSFSMREI